MKKLKLAAILGLIFLLFSCGTSKQPELFYDISIKNILVLPLTSYSTYEKEFFKVPFRGVITGKIEPGAEEELNSLLKAKLTTLPYNFKFLSLSEFNNLVTEILSAEETSHQRIIQILCERTGTDAILYGKIYRYKEREGTGFSVNEPASVAFGLVLYEGKTGKILWTRVFDETQKPLSENILNLRLYKKLKWLTAKELASNGIELLLESFPLMIK